MKVKLFVFEEVVKDRCLMLIVTSAEKNDNCIFKSTKKNNVDFYISL